MTKVIKAETKAKQIKVLEILELEGYRWLAGQAPTKYISYINPINKENKYIRINESTKKLTTRKWLEPGDIEIPYEQFISKNKKVIL